MTAEDPLAAVCRTCGALEGIACMTPAGWRCAPHSARKPKPYSSFRRRLTPRAIEHQTVMSVLRPKVFDRDGRGCMRCRARQRLQAHHRLPTGRGGADTMENLVTLCERCHNWVHRHPDESRALGLLFASWDGAPSEPWTRPKA